MTVLTLIHVVISLIGIASGFVVLFGLLTGKTLDGWTGLFLTSAVATSVTGFLLPFHRFMPSHVIGILSLLGLAVAVVARYPSNLVGAWRWIYVLSALSAFYLNFFVLVAQAFAKVPALKVMAPTQSEPPFLISEFIVMALFIVLSIAAIKRFRVESSGAIHAV